MELGTRFVNDVQEYKWKQNPEYTGYTWKLHIYMTI